MADALTSEDKCDLVTLHVALQLYVYYLASLC